MNYCTGYKDAHPPRPSEESIQTALKEKFNVHSIYLDMILEGIKVNETELIWARKYLKDGNFDNAILAWTGWNSESSLLKATRLEDGSIKMKCEAPETLQGDDIKYNFVKSTRKGIKFLSRRQEDPYFTLEKSNVMDGEYLCYVNGEKQVFAGKRVVVKKGGILAQTCVTAHLEEKNKGNSWRTIDCSDERRFARPICIAPPKEMEADENDRVDIDTEQVAQQEATQEKQAVMQEESNSSGSKANRRVLLKAKLVRLLKQELYNVS